MKTLEFHNLKLLGKPGRKHRFTFTIWKDFSLKTSFIGPKLSENLDTVFSVITSHDSPPISLSPAIWILEIPSGVLKILSCLT